MAFQPINIGTNPNDGTGDTLRDAMDKTNDNFDSVQVGSTDIDKIPFKTGLAKPTHKEGLIWYDNQHKTLGMMNDINGSILELGRELWERCFNNSGAIITNGSVVHITGINGENPTIELAKADALSTTDVLGIATHDIGIGAFGEVTAYGKVNDINTNSWPSGTQLYLSHDTAGALTDIAPPIPNFIVPVCIVYKEGSADGIFGVRIGQIIPPNESGESWSYASYKNISNDINWIGGFMETAGAFTPAGGTDFGEADEMHTAHAFIVLGASSTNMVIRITGDRFDPATGVTTAGYTSDIDTSGGVLNDFFETPEHFVGTVTYTLLSGTGVIINGGLIAYWDNNNKRFSLTQIEWIGLSGADDSVDMEVYHKQDSAFTYDVTGAIITPMIKISDELGSNILVKQGRPLKYKRSGLSDIINGDLDEGIFFKVTITQTDTILYSNIVIQFLERRVL